MRSKVWQWAASGNIIGGIVRTAGETEGSIWLKYQGHQKWGFDIMNDVERKANL